MDQGTNGPSNPNICQTPLLSLEIFQLLMTQLLGYELIAPFAFSVLEK